LGAFSLAGVGSTDGIDVVNVALGDAFPTGLFTAHNGADCCPVQGASWGAVAEEVGLEVDVDGWSPRRGCEGSVGESGSDDGSANDDDGDGSGSAGDDGSDGADASASAGDGTGAATTTGGDPDGGSDESAASDAVDDGASGCGCRAGAGARSAALVLVAALVGRRRRAARRRSV
ncbi:MAG TPA: hypothetical protein VFG69_09290, partial [Nannocystaceae bacterium]|nr:hypothetical protein [Nannocystaceae bacterium]